VDILASVEKKVNGGRVVVGPFVLAYVVVEFFVVVSEAT